MKLIIYILLFFYSFFPFTSYGQSDFDLSQRFFNEAVYNPAATGNTFTSGFFLQLRKQWMGLEGAPTTEVFSADAYMEKFQSAIGFSITGDQIGFTNTYTVRGSYAYYIALTNSSALSLGASAGIVNRNKNANGALVDNLNDGELYYGSISEYSPDFDFGFEYQGFMKIGASIRHIGFQPSKNTFPNNSKNIWAYASSRFNIFHNFSVEPTFSYMHRNDINRYEIGALFYIFKSTNYKYYNDKYWIGAMYRLNNQFSVLAGIHITPKLRLGYSFDYGHGTLNTLSQKGTHEIFLAWQFNRLFYKDTKKDCCAYKNSGGYYNKEKENKMKKLYYKFY